MPDDIDHLEELIPPLKTGPGANNPPSDIEILQQALEESSAHLIQRRDDLLASVARAPLVVEDEETCGKMADLIKFVMSCHKAAETTRVGKKEPFLQCSRIVDGFFRAITDPLEKARKLIEPRITAYQRVKAEQERRRREEESRRAAEEAERLRKAAVEAEKQVDTESELDAAISAATLAQRADADAAGAEKATTAKAAELSRSRGDLGAVASLRTFWDFKDLDRHTVDLEALRPYLALEAIEKAVRAYVKAQFQPGHPGAQIRGVAIYENTGTRVS